MGKAKSMTRMHSEKQTMASLIGRIGVLSKSIAFVLEKYGKQVKIRSRMIKMCVS
jgi:hypothetical protein